MSHLHGVKEEKKVLSSVLKVLCGFSKLIEFKWHWMHLKKQQIEIVCKNILEIMLIRGKLFVVWALTAVDASRSCLMRSIM